MIRHALACTALSILLLVPGRTFAQAANTETSAGDVATARELFREAAALAQEGKWDLALDRYERSMALRPSPLTRYSIAVAQSHTGRLIEASENIRTFFHEATADLQPYVQPAEDLLRSLEPRIARLTIRIPGDPRGARVLLDGRELPAAAVGVERLVNPGTHKIEATVPEHATFFQQLDLGEGASKIVLVALSRDTTAPTPDAIAQQPSDGAKTAGKVLLAVGGATFVAGGVLGVLGWSKAKDSPTSDGDKAESAKTFALVGDVSMGVGVLAAGIGTYLLVTAPSTRSPTAITISPWTTTSSAGVGLSGGF